MDMKKILQALDSASEKPAVDSNDMKKFLRVVAEGAPVAQQQSPEQIAYNQLRAQLDSADSLRGGANTYTDVSPEVAASTAAMKQKLAQMAAALKAKGIDAEAEYNAPDPNVPAATPVDLSQKYQSEEAAPVAQPDPKYVEYAQLMAKYDLLAKEAGMDGNNNIVDVNAGASPDAVAEIGKIKARAEQLAGANLQAWEQARQKENAGSMAQAQANVPALAAQLENVGMSRLLSIVTEGKGPLNRPTAAESLTMQHYTAPKKTITSPVLNVQEGAKPSMIGKYFKAVEQELREAAEKPNERAQKLAQRVIERIVPNADGSLPDPSINRLTGKPNPPAAEPAPTNVKPSGSTVDYGGATYNLVGVFGDGIRPRIGRGDKVIPAKAYVLGDKMYVLFDQGVAEVAGPEKCWPGHRKVGTKPGTGKNAGKRVNDCEKIGEATSAAQQAAIAIAKKKAGKK